ncbi:MAG: transposase [Acidimicrobiia bacterium]|nr:transposase [Acidimicrobiia bacterium]
MDETSIRRRHRYVTVVACGDTGKVLAMIEVRTKGSLSRFFRDQGPDLVPKGGDSRLRRVPALIRRPSPSTCPTLATSSTASMLLGGSPKG